jgi:hypothetical protein
MKSRPKPIKRKTKRKAAPPVLTAGGKRSSRFEPGESGNPDAQFKPGVSGNPAGRPLGARSRLTEAFLVALGEAWAQHGAACLEWLAKNDKALFVQVVASLVPRHMKAEIDIERMGVAPIINLIGRPEAVAARANRQSP